MKLQRYPAAIQAQAMLDSDASDQITMPSPVGCPNIKICFINSKSSPIIRSFEHYHLKFLHSTILY